MQRRMHFFCMCRARKRERKNHLIYLGTTPLLMKIHRTHTHTHKYTLVAIIGPFNVSLQNLHFCGRNSNRFRKYNIFENSPIMFVEQCSLSISHAHDCKMSYRIFINRSCFIKTNFSEDNIHLNLKKITKIDLILV